MRKTLKSDAFIVKTDEDLRIVYPYQKISKGVKESNKHRKEITTHPTFTE